MVTRYEKGVYLDSDECKVAYVQGKRLIVEREPPYSVISFPMKNAEEADRVARRINEDININRTRRRAERLTDSFGSPC